MAKIKVTLVKSYFGRTHSQKRILDSLGLRKCNGSIIHDDTSTIRGMITKMSHLLTVESVTGS